MTDDELREAIEVLKDYSKKLQGINLRDDMSYILLTKKEVNEALTFAISTLESLQQAREDLGGKIEIV